MPGTTDEVHQENLRLRTEVSELRQECTRLAALLWETRVAKGLEKPVPTEEEKVRATVAAMRAAGARSGHRPVRPTSGRGCVTSAADKRHLSRVASLGCVVCRNLGVDPEIPSGIHHLRNGYGRGQAAPHTETLPLCGYHHQTGGYGNAFHAGPAEWERRYGTERQLLAQVRAELGD